MALVACRGCGTEVSTEAPTCPVCGTATPARREGVGTPVEGLDALGPGLSRWAEWIEARLRAGISADQIAETLVEKGVADLPLGQRMARHVAKDRTCRECGAPIESMDGACARCGVPEPLGVETQSRETAQDEVPTDLRSATAFQFFRDEARGGGDVLSENVPDRCGLVSSWVCLSSR